MHEARRAAGRVWAVACGAVALLGAVAAGRAAARPPDVLLIAIDDLNDWVGHLGGHPAATTPHIDALAARGTTFLNAHCQAPLCNPSRTSLLLSLRPGTTGIYGLRPAYRAVERWRDRVSLPRHFAANGYRTVGVGKIFHEGNGKPGEEFDEPGPAIGMGPRPPAKLVPPTPMGNHPALDWGPFPHADESKGDHRITTWAIEQLAVRHDERPLFLAVGYLLPHVPCHATAPWFEPFADDDTILPAILRGDRGDTPRFSWYLHWELPEPRRAWLEETAQWRPLVRSYLACTRFVDAQIGRLLAALDASGRRDDFVVVLWSDHGWHLGEKGITGKNSLWDEATRVPLVFAGPGIAAGGRVTSPAELLDVYPTLVELCGLPPRDDLEGLSLVPQLRRADAPRDRPARTTHNAGNHAVRTTHHRYIRYADGSEELYDHRTDPDEWHNLAGAPSANDTIAALRRALPAADAPAAPGSADRILVYDGATDTAVWENRITIGRATPIP
ncbi:MAG: sulfatase [Planctomycetaceae bacterium]